MDEALFEVPGSPILERSGGAHFKSRDQRNDSIAFDLNAGLWEERRPSQGDLLPGERRNGTDEQRYMTCTPWLCQRGWNSRESKTIGCLGENHVSTGAKGMTWRSGGDLADRKQIKQYREPWQQFPSLLCVTARPNDTGGAYWPPNVQRTETATCSRPRKPSGLRRCGSRCGRATAPAQSSRCVPAPGPWPVPGSQQAKRQPAPTGRRR